MQFTENVFLFKLVQFGVLFIFAVVISDIRKKRGMVPLINGKMTLALKFICLVPITVYGYTFFTLDWLSNFDFVAFALTFLGTLLAAKAKRDLGQSHTWTGYHFKKTKLVVKGIYAYIRHPIYVGVYVFVFGSISTLIAHAPLLLTTIFLATSVYVMLFLAASASLETKFLVQEFGADFLKYKNQVHPFLPVRKYEKSIWTERSARDLRERQVRGSPVLR